MIGISIIGKKETGLQIEKNPEPYHGIKDPDSDERNNSGKTGEQPGADVWATYKNDRYQFEISYPQEWELKIMSSDPNDPSREDSFVFQKDPKNYFAIFTNGGYGHGIPAAKRVTTEQFKGRAARMFWYEHQFPHYIALTDDLPESWNTDNGLELRIEDESQQTAEILNEMYNSFQFIK